MPRPANGARVLANFGHVWTAVPGTVICNVPMPTALDRNAWAAVILLDTGRVIYCFNLVDHGWVGCSLLRK